MARRLERDHNIIVMELLGHVLTPVLRHEIVSEAGSLVEQGQTDIGKDKAAVLIQEIV